MLSATATQVSAVELNGSLEQASMAVEEAKKRFLACLVDGATWLNNAAYEQMQREVFVVEYTVIGEQLQSIGHEDEDVGL